MRGIIGQSPRLPAARALIASFAIIAGMSATRAHAQPPNGAEDTALAVPRILSRGGTGVALPQPLPPSEVARIKRIFALQARGAIPAALAETIEVETTTPLGMGMLGHILAQRYLGPGTRPGADELQSWLDKWSDLPDAPAVHSLLLSRLPRGMRRPVAPVVARLPAPPDVESQPATAPVPEETQRAGHTLSRNYGLDRSVADAVRSGRPYAADRAITHSGVSATYSAQLRGEAGRILLTLNRDEEAFDTAAAGVRACGPAAGCENAALAGYIAGLAAWRLGRVDVARGMFDMAWRADYTTSALKSGAAFWAGRAHARLDDEPGAVSWFMRAAEQQTTFYGLLARRSLGWGYGVTLGPKELLAEADVDAISATAPGLRAFALLQTGQTGRAEAEFRRMWPLMQNNAALGRAVMLVAVRAGMLSLGAHLADLVQTADGRPRYGMRFPVPRLQPIGGFTVDPALVYALTRTESNFDTEMISHAGATGLMQIMPDTARFITGATTRVSLRGVLHDPGVNLDLGQRYIVYLASSEIIGGNLIKVLAGYNAGPGNVAHFSPGIRDGGDPLMYIETIPIDETRAYVPRVLTYTWIYAARMRLPMPSLDELAAGEWPRYHPVETAPPATKTEAAARTTH